MDLSHFATKINRKGIICIDTFILASKIHLADWETKVDNLGIDKLKTVLADLSKLGNTVDNNVVKKTVYDKSVLTSMLLILGH